MKQPTVLCVFQKLLLNLILKCSSKHARCGESKCTSFFTICYFDNNLSIYFHTVLPFSRAQSPSNIPSSLLINYRQFEVCSW